jgi:hypothetical protein
MPNIKAREMAAITTRITAGMAKATGPFLGRSIPTFRFPIIGEDSTRTLSRELVSFEEVATGGGFLAWGHQVPQRRRPA